MRRVRAALGRQWRWALVGTGTAGLLVLPVVVASWPAHSSGLGVPALTARMLSSATQPYEGYAEGHGGLRLPELPGAADLSTLTSDTSRMRVWYAAPDSWRNDLLYSGGERDRYRSPDGLWTWDSGVHRATFTPGETQLRLPIPSDLAPPDLARRLLAAAAPSEITALSARRIAGHDGDGVRIVPVSAATTIGRVDVSAYTRTG